MEINIKKNSSLSVALITLLLCTFILVQPALANPPLPSSQNITAQQAEHMIKTNKDIVILDVRNETEYIGGHLYNAIWIPLYELENRIAELEDKQNSLIIVYCGVGGRSVVACQILENHGFTKIYSMIGGITAWMEAGYLINTSTHYITVDTSKPNTCIQIDPMLLKQSLPDCGCEPNQTAPDVNNTTLSSFTSTVLQENATYQVTRLQYLENDTLVEVTLTTSLLWQLKQSTHDSNRTIEFISTKIDSNNESMQTYILNDNVITQTYNLTLYTTILASESGNYETAFTNINYVPMDNKTRTTYELITFNSSVTLSEQYKIVSDISGELEKIYQKSDDSSLQQFTDAYKAMKQESKDVSVIVKTQLREYDKAIEQSVITLSDQDPLACLSSILGCMLSIVSMPSLLATCYLCAQVVTCIPTCVAIFTIPVCLLCIGTGIVGCLTCLYIVGVLPYECWNAGRCLGIW
ncbi:MAG: rhodanese-like domain-containing protein [Nitrososphaerota archaeon]|jgi:rhodanese-related sulfurtransferase|nr:rhodanese-like domain-containing protein [Nitrososphaerota archaeon]